MPSSDMLRRVALVRTDVSEERIAFIIMVTRIGELGTTLAPRFLQEPPCVTSPKTEFFVVTAVKTSNLNRDNFSPPGIEEEILVVKRETVRSAAQAVSRLLPTAAAPAPARLK
jgi:hypothetical protein